VTRPVEQRNARLMRDMFHTIAPRYDFITRVFSYGMDRRWKHTAVTHAALPPDALVLDLAAGTADFSKLLAARAPGTRSIAVDLTERMLQLARSSGVPEAVCADACVLPFRDAMFDAVFIGYGLRNFPNLDGAIREVRRVTRPGGLLVSLDFFLPANRVLRKLYISYLYAQGAFWGAVLHGRPRVYTYIPDSLRAFVTVDEFATRLRQAGYREVESRPFILGGIALHWAR